MKESWATEVGVRTKPETCKVCPFAAKGRGFCPDLVPEKPLVAFIFDTPTKEEITNQEFLSGAQGFVWKKLLIEELGYKIDDVLVSSVLRCSCPSGKFGRPDYPTAWLGRQAELNCRQYDDELNRFDPNVFVITLHPRTINTVGCHKIQIQRDVEKAFRFAKQGYRPVVLFGDASAELYAPFIKNNGGIKNWRSHWWVGSSPFKDKERNEKNVNKRRFAEG